MTSSKSIHVGRDLIEEGEEEGGGGGGGVGRYKSQFSFSGLLLPKYQSHAFGISSSSAPNPNFPVKT